MFSESELIEYEKEFQRFNKNLNKTERVAILEFLYSFGVIAYELINKEENN